MGVKKSVVIIIDQKTINDAVQGNSAMCMVSEAIRHIGGRKPHTDMQTIRYTDEKGVRRTYLTPAAVQQALVRFDAGDDVQPFEFKLHHPVHISKAAVPHTGGAPKKATERGRTFKPATTIGGRAIPLMGNSTRRKFGIRNLRINEEGKVVQTGVLVTDTA